MLQKKFPYARKKSFSLFHPTFHTSLDARKRFAVDTTVILQLHQKDIKVFPAFLFSPLLEEKENLTLVDQIQINIL
jgi:hypothetical protein